MTAKPVARPKTSNETRRMRTDKAPPARANATTPAAKAPSKTETLIALLSREKGATIADMMVATDWMAHSVRGFMAGALRKRLGHAVMSEVTDGGRVYRLAPKAAAV